MVWGAMGARLFFVSVLPRAVVYPDGICILRSHGSAFPPPPRPLPKPQFGQNALVTASGGQCKSKPRLRSNAITLERKHHRTFAQGGAHGGTRARAFTCSMHASFAVLSCMRIRPVIDATWKFWTLRAFPPAHPTPGVRTKIADDR
eukprot:3394905-Pyramimonas_sp.AAC.1